MDRIVAFIHPFVLLQEVNVYINGDIKKTIECPLKDLDKVCYELCKENNIHQLDLKGQHQYALHLKDQLTSTKYNDFDINIKIY